MLGDLTKVEHIYLACGHTDMRKAIDGLAAIVVENFKLDPFSSSLFLFCGRKRDRLKALYFAGDGFILLYKRLESGKFKWPRDETEVRELSAKELRWLMEGLSVDQPGAVREIGPKKVL